MISLRRCTNVFERARLQATRRYGDQLEDEYQGRIFPDSSSLAVTGRKKANAHPLLTALKSCTIRRDLEWGRNLHAKAVESGIESNTDVVIALIKMYSKCDRMIEARRLFDGIQNPNVVAWNTLLLGYADSGEGLTVLDLFSSLKASGNSPDSVTYVAALKGCASMALTADVSGKEDFLERGRVIHSDIGCHLNQYVQNTLIDMYSKCSSMIQAQRVFDSIQKPDVVSWTALLLGYAENGDGLAALDLFSRMKASGCVPNSVTYVAALKACTSLGVHDNRRDSLERVTEIHSEIGSHLQLYVQNTLVYVYAKCGSMVDARCVFESIAKPNVVSWTALLLGYAENGEAGAALELFSRMKARGCAPNSVTYVAALKACTSLVVNGDRNDYLERCRQIHGEIGCNLDRHVQNTLLDMYAKCGSMVEARRVFDNIQKPNVVSWTALLLGYAENGEGLTALELFFRMKSHGCLPNSVTYIAALKACTSLAVTRDESGKRDCLEQGRKIHSEIGCHLDNYVQNTLIDMYANCGSMFEARRVFESIKNPQVVSWNVLLLGYAENGDGNSTLELFSRMKTRACADSVTFIAALKACVLTGSLALGRKVHLEITEFTAHVVTCLVDFYAKCGSMTEARQVFDLHSSARIVSTWNALLAGYGSFDSGSVFNLFEAMQDEGFRPDGVTFVCILLCCSHAGLVGKAREYFEAMSMQYGVTPTIMHFTCMVDVLGRVNQLNEAIVVIRKMPCLPSAVTWTTLLGACRKWKNVDIGRWAFQSLVDMDKKNASAYILMAQIYGSRGMWEEQERVLEAKTKFGASGQTDDLGKTSISDRETESIAYAEHYAAIVGDAPGRRMPGEFTSRSRLQWG